MKASKKLWLLRMGLLGILLVGMFFIQSIDASHPQKTYDQAKKDCGSEIWLIGEDIGYVSIVVGPPYPEKVTDAFGERLTDYACDPTTANQKIEDLNRWSFPSYMLVLLIVAIGPPLALVVVVLWIIEEVKYWKSRGKKVVPNHKPRH